MDYSAEDRLLVLALDPGAGPAAQDEAAELLRQPLDWDRLLERASWQSVPTLLLYLLRSVPERPLPDTPLARLSAGFRAHAVRSMLIAAQLPDVLRGLRGAGVDALVLKGGALATTLYPDPALRPMGDLDILVPRRQLELAEHALGAMGYRCVGYHEPEHNRLHHHHLTYVPPRAGLPVELHWHIANPDHPVRVGITDPALIERWFQRAETIELHGLPARVLGDADLLLHLALHFLRHRFDSRRAGFVSEGALRQLADIRLVLTRRAQRIDWNLLWEEADRYAVSGPLAAALALALDPLGRHGPAPPGIRHKLDGDGETALELMRRRILAQADDQRTYSYNVHQWLNAPDHGARARALMRIVFPPRRVLARKYGLQARSPRLYVRYVTRPFELLFAHNRMRGDARRLQEEGVLRRWLGVLD